MPKHIDNVPKLDDFRPPWVTEDGQEVEIDKDKLKRYIHNLVADKAKAQDSRDEAVDKVKGLETTVGELQKQVDEKDPDAATKVAAERDKTKQAEDRASQAELALTRLEVAIEAGLTPSQAKRLTGSTKEELEADAKSFAEELGIQPGSSKDDDEVDDDTDGRTQPVLQQRSLVTPGSRLGGAGDEVDFESVAGQLVGGSVL